jgi:hypothetical protein
MPAFRAGRTALVRAAARPPAVPVSSCPELGTGSPEELDACAAWLREVWTDEALAEAIRYASPGLAAQVGAVCDADRPRERDVRRATRSVARYLLRAEHRATPFGLFAGVAVASFGERAAVEWGDGHVAVSRAGAEWLAAVVGRLVACPDLVDRLPVVVNNTVTRRGDRLVVPYQSTIDGGPAHAVDVSLALTAPVRTVLTAARKPTPFGELADKLRTEFPAAEATRARQLLEELIRRRVLLTSLETPSTETDALGHLLHQLDDVRAGSLPSVATTVTALKRIRTELGRCSTRSERERVASRMRALAPGLQPHPLAVDLRLDARLDLPGAVAREVERAAWVLTRLSARPYGTAAWGGRITSGSTSGTGSARWCRCWRSSATAGSGFPTATRVPRQGRGGRVCPSGMTFWCGWRSPPCSTAGTR